MGSYDSTKISELVGCLLLYKLNETIDPGYHGLYQDDGLIIIYISIFFLFLVLGPREKKGNISK